VFFGLGPAIFVSLLSIVAYIYFFLEPFFALSISAAQQVITLIIFLTIAVIISFLASGLRQKTEEAIREISARKKSESELVRYRNRLENWSSKELPNWRKLRVSWKLKCMNGPWNWKKVKKNTVSWWKMLTRR
jgi:two-component system sensor histidine kinase KdpD